MGRQFCSNKIIPIKSVANFSFTFNAFFIKIDKDLILCLLLFPHDFSTSICLKDFCLSSVAADVAAASAAATTAATADAWRPDAEAARWLPVGCGLPEGPRESGQHLLDQIARLVAILGERGARDLHEDVGQFGRLVGLGRPPRRPLRRAQADPPASGR